MRIAEADEERAGSGTWESYSFTLTSNYNTRSLMACSGGTTGSHVFLKDEG